MTAVSESAVGFEFLWLIAGDSKELTFSFFSQIKFFIRNENFIITPDSSRSDSQFHVTRNHIDVFPNAVIDLTRCVTEKKRKRKQEITPEGEGGSGRQASATENT